MSPRHPPRTTHWTFEMMGLGQDFVRWSSLSKDAEGYPKKMEAALN